MIGIRKKISIIFLAFLILSWLAAPVLAAAAVGIVITETTFSPNGDGFRDTTEIHWSQSEGGNVTVRALQGGRVVTNLGVWNGLGAGPHAFVWAGTTAYNGGPGLADGRYTIQVLVANANGTGSASADVIINRSLIGPGGIENGAVTGDKIAFGAVNGNHIAPGSIGAAHLQTIALGSAQIGAGAIQNQHLAANAVTSDKIANGTIQTGDLQNAAVTAAKINNAGLDADTVDGKHGADIDAADAANAAAIAVNTANIAQNTADIATNAADIATNAGNIVTNTNDIITLGGFIATESATRQSADDNLQNQLNDLSTLLSSETVNRANQDIAVFNAAQTAINAGDAALQTQINQLASNSLNSQLLGANMRILSGEATLSVGAMGVVGPVNSTLATPFSGTPLVIVSLSDLGSDYAGTSISDLMGSGTTDTIAIQMKVTDASANPADVARVRWIAIGN